MPKALEYDRVVKAALLNWILGIAQGLVEHGTEGGLDAWRKLYHRYIPLADHMQNIRIRKLMCLKLVNEGDMDNLFDEAERIREQYIKIGSSECPMSEKIEKGALDIPVGSLGGLLIGISTVLSSSVHLAH